MNRIPKLVASHTLADVSAWTYSRVIDEDVLMAVKEQVRSRDVVVAGSASVVHALAEADLVDEYRILLFPTALGTGTRLFAAGAAPAHLRLVSGARGTGRTSALRAGDRLIHHRQRGHRPRSPATRAPRADRVKASGGCPQTLGPLLTCTYYRTPDGGHGPFAPGSRV